MKRFFKDDELNDLCLAYIQSYANDNFKVQHITYNGIRKLVDGDDKVNDIILDLEFYYSFTRKHNSGHIQHWINKHPLLNDLTTLYTVAMQKQDMRSIVALSKDFIEILGIDEADYFIDALNYYIIGVWYKYYVW